MSKYIIMCIYVVDNIIVAFMINDSWTRQKSSNMLNRRKIAKLTIANKVNYQLLID